MKRITKFWACVLISASICTHLLAQSRSRVVAGSDRSPNQLALKLKATLAGHRTQVYQVAFSPDATLVATTDYAETKVWTTSGQLLYTLDTRTPHFSPDGGVLLTVDGKDVNLWDSVTGKLKQTLTGHDDKISTVDFSSDGSKLATASQDGTVKLWDVAAGRVLTTLRVHPVKKIARFRIFSRLAHIPIRLYVKFSPDGKFIATHAIEYVDVDVVKLWDTATGTLIKEFKDMFAVVEFSPDSKWLGFLKIGAGVGVLNLGTLQIQTNSDVDSYFRNQHAFSPDSRMYVTASGYDTYSARLVDVSTGRMTTKIKLYAKYGSDFVSEYQKDSDLLSFHPSSKFLMGANHKSVRMWDVSTGQIVCETTEGRDPASFSADGKLLVTVAKDKKTVLLWEVTN